MNVQRAEELCGQNNGFFDGRRYNGDEEILNNNYAMAIVSVDVPDKIAKNLEPFQVVGFEDLLSQSSENISFDFKKENIDQDEFLATLKSMNG